MNGNPIVHRQPIRGEIKEEKKIGELEEEKRAGGQPGWRAFPPALISAIRTIKIR